MLFCLFLPPSDKLLLYGSALFFLSVVFLYSTNVVYPLKIPNTPLRGRNGLIPDGEFLIFFRNERSEKVNSFSVLSLVDPTNRLLTQHIRNIPIDPKAKKTTSETVQFSAATKSKFHLCRGTGLPENPIF